jgi:hypothetical protein
MAFQSVEEILSLPKMAIQKFRYKPKETCKDMKLDKKRFRKIALQTHPDKYNSATRASQEGRRVSPEEWDEFYEMMKQCRQTTKNEDAESSGYLLDSLSSVVGPETTDPLPVLSKNELELSNQLVMHSAGAGNFNSELLAIKDDRTRRNVALGMLMSLQADHSEKSFMTPNTRTAVERLINRMNSMQTQQRELDQLRKNLSNPLNPGNTFFQNSNELWSAFKEKRSVHPGLQVTEKTLVQALVYELRSVFRSQAGGNVCALWLQDRISQEYKKPDTGMCDETKAGSLILKLRSFLNNQRQKSIFDRTIYDYAELFWYKGPTDQLSPRKPMGMYIKILLDNLASMAGTTS